jgi:o-succinylbenzoate---CoA ligase
VSERATVFPDWIAHRAAGMPARTALVVGNSDWTFAELDSEVSKTARKLGTLGVSAGDRVAVLLHNGIEMAVLPHAVLRLGATLVPLNLRLSEQELAWQLGDSQPRLLIVDDRSRQLAMTAAKNHPAIRIVSTATRQLEKTVALLSRVKESETALRSEHSADAVVAIIYTSGTTGRPKGAMLTVSNFWWSAVGSALNLGTHADDKWLACMPLFHVGGLSILLRAAIYGITAVVHEGFDETAVNAAIDNDGVTIVSVVAVMLERMLDQRAGAAYPPSLRCLLVGGGPAPMSLLERCESISAPVVQTYGLTETCSQVATLSPADAYARHGSAGKALYPSEIRIASSADGASSDDAGEILVRGPVVMAGYAGKPAETSRALADGWLHTGDIGRLDEDGYLYVLDRRDDLIVTGGENVYPAEVEAVLFSHPAIAEAGVIGVSDDTWGQRVVAIARLSSLHDGPAPDAAILESYCRSRLAGFKIPREFRFVRDALPRTASGKLRRGALRQIVKDS